MRSWVPFAVIVAMVATGLLVRFDYWGITNWALILGAILLAAALGLYWKRSP